MINNGNFQASQKCQDRGNMRGVGMETLIAGCAFLGAVLGRSFKILALVPANIFAVAVLLKRESAGGTGADFFLGFSAVVTSLELGYIAGLILTDISGLAQSFTGD
jgi:hypothetical protein